MKTNWLFALLIQESSESTMPAPPTPAPTPTEGPPPPPPPPPAMQQQQQPSFNAVMTKALQGGISGASAMGIQVTTLMWMRTTMNYQYRYGTSTTQAMK